MNDDAKLENLAKRLGTAAAQRLDVEATTRTVLAALRETPTRPRTWIEVHALRIAAAIVLLVGGSVVVSQLNRGGHPALRRSHPAHLIADDLGDLTNDELQAVLNQFDELVDSNSAISDSTDLRELDAQELREVLRSLEG